MNLHEIEEGGIFTATCRNGARKICLVERINHDKIVGRTITTQEVILFSLASGKAETPQFDCQIINTKKIPSNLYRIMLQIDRKYRLMDAPEGPRLLQEEIDGMMNLDKFYNE